MEADIATLEEQLREAMLASDVASPGVLRFHRIDPSERRILMLEQAAFLGVRVHLSGVFSGSPFQEDLQLSRLWQRHVSGAWLVIAGQATRVQAPAPPSS